MWFLVNTEKVNADFVNLNLTACEHESHSSLVVHFVCPASNLAQLPMNSVVDIDIAPAQLEETVSEHNSEYYISFKTYLAK